MIKYYSLLIALLLLNLISARAQKTATDSLKIEELRQYPRKNSLPVTRPALIVRPIPVPDAFEKMKVNYWRTWLTFGVNLNQAAFSNNWSGGGINSLALGTQLNFKTDFTKGDKNYVSELILQYGKLKNKGQLERKTNDRIFWDNKGGLKLSKSWFFFGSVNFESQFDEGYTYNNNAQGYEERLLISRFMSPGYLTESFGFEYKPSKEFYLRIGTGTARQTFVLDTTLYKTNPKNFGVPKGNVFRNELAFQVVSNVDKDIAKNINLKSRYALFANYKRLNHIDHRLDVTLSAKVNKLINVSIAAIALYDDDTSDKIQSSQSLSLGLVYRFLE
ncbi:MAG: hypothetical protein JWQ25_2034 [Daejeonella sp.]|nr:hypothetical protein [Daejeonella sp.]